MRMIVAVDEDNAIGWADGRLPWKSKTDLARFKQLTTSRSVSEILMGRKTYESIGRPLPNRITYVLSPSGSLGHLPKHPDLTVVNAQLSKLNTYFVTTDMWLCGGAQLYNEALDLGLISELYITQVHVQSGADVKLKHDLFNWKRFAVHELTHSRAWSLLDVAVPTIPATEPGITFLHLVRTQ